MTEKNDRFSTRQGATAEVSDPLRRKLLLWLPAAVFVSIGATLATVAFRFLRPESSTMGGENSPGEWSAVAPVAELNGAQPLLRKVTVEQRAGWSATRREHIVFVLPQRNNRVVSAVCPHEGCAVDWRAESREFFCPCHDSRFDDAGARLNGPAEHDLTALPTRIENGVLQVLYQPAALEGGRNQEQSHG